MLKIKMDRKRLLEEENNLLKEKIDNLQLENDFMKNILTLLQNEINELKMKLDLSPRKLSEIDVFGIANLMADNAWNGKNSESTIYDLIGSPVLSFHGHTYEPGYEEFASTCAIYGYNAEKEKIILFDEEDYSAAAYCHKVKMTGSKSLVNQYISEHDTYVEVNIKQ